MGFGAQPAVSRKARRHRMTKIRNSNREESETGRASLLDTVGHWPTSARRALISRDVSRPTNHLSWMDYARQPGDKFTISDGTRGRCAAAAIEALTNGPFPERHHCDLWPSIWVHRMKDVTPAVLRFVTAVAALPQLRRIVPLRDGRRFLLTSRPRSSEFWIACSESTGAPRTLPYGLQPVTTESPI